MTDAAVDDDELDDEEEQDSEGSGKRRFSGKFIVLFVVLPVLGLVAAGLAAYFFLFAGDAADEEAAALAESGPAPVFYDLPEFLVNLDSPGSAAKFLKMRVSLEITDPEVAAQLDVVMPRVLDGFQVFLRELRVEDLQGSAGVVRLKEELLRRINLVVQPSVVNDILFQEIVIQ